MYPKKVQAISEFSYFFSIFRSCLMLRLLPSVPFLGTPSLIPYTPNDMKTIHSLGYRALLAWLREQRVDRGLSMRALAERLDIPHSWVGKIETGERRLDLYEYLRLCAALKTDFRKGIDVLLQAESVYSVDKGCWAPKVAGDRKSFEANGHRK